MAPSSQDDSPEQPLADDGSPDAGTPADADAPPPDPNPNPSDGGLPPGGASAGAVQQEPVAAAPNNVVSVNVVPARPADVFMFIIAVLQRDWLTAYLNVNGLCMLDMLKGMAALDRLDLADLMNQSAAFVDAVYMPRIEYAVNVVQTQAIPPNAPGDLQLTGQVQDCRNYLATHPRLFFPYDLTSTLPLPLAHPPSVTRADLEAAAQTLNVEVAAIRAVAQVEAGGAPFAPNGAPIIRYELHLLKGEIEKAQGAGVAAGYQRTHPYLCNDYQAGRGFHGGGQPNEWSMLYNAMILRGQKESALRSASYGKYQVMGFNFSDGRWGSVSAFTSDMFVSEGQQLKAFLGYVQTHHLVGFMQRHDWASFANGYNGSSYADNNYDGQMAAAYQRFAREEAARAAATSPASTPAPVSSSPPSSPAPSGP